MSEYSNDIYTEPSNIDLDTLANLGPLRPMAGIWEGQRGLDIKPKADRGAMLLISPTVTSSAFDGQDDRLFRVIASTREYARKSAWFHAERQGLRRLAVVLDDNNLAFTQRWLDDFEAEFVRLGGRIISRVSYDLQAIPSFNQIVAGALAGQPDGLLILANAADAALLVQQARKLAPTVPLLSSEWSATDAFLALAGAADNVSAVFRTTILQAATPDEFRGRLQGVFTVVTWPFRALIVVGSVVAAVAYLGCIPSLLRQPTVQGGSA